MKTTMKRICAAAAKAAVALAVALGLVQTAEAAHTWTGAVNGDIDNKSNYSAYTYSCYFKTSNLSGNKVTTVYLSKNVGNVALAGETTKRYRALDFENGSWQLHGKPGDTMYTLDNAAGHDSSNDKDRICVGCAWTGAATAGDGALRMHAINAKLYTLLVGSNVAASPTKGTLIIDDKAEDGTTYHGKVTITTQSDIQLYNGRIESSEANVTATGIMNMGYSDNANTELVINSGTWKTTRMWMSRNNNNVSKLYVKGGTLQMTGSGNDGRITVGTNSGMTTNYVEVSGGTVDCSSGTAFRLGGDGNANAWSEMLLSGGQVKCKDFYVGDGSSAKLTMTGGTLDASSGWVYFAKSAGCAADESCELNLGSGTLTTKRLTYGGGSAPAVLNLSGGTLKAVYDTAEYLNDFANLTVNVGAGGAIFDTDGFAITVSEPLNAATGVAGDLTVTGGGSAAFAGMGDLAGALTVGDSTTLHWFDQDGAVSATPGFTSLALGAGATVYLDGDATAVDALPATVTTTATTENKANVAINFSVIPATGSTYTLFSAASADVFNVQPSYAGIPLPCEVTVVGGNIVLTIVAEDYTWNGTGTNWGDDGAWTKGGAAATWADGNNAIFNTASATATLAANASPAKIDFSADATVDGVATLTVPSVSVAQGVSATVTAPTAGGIEKTGAGALALGASRTEQTTVTEGTLKVLSGATVDPAKLTLGTDAAKPVALDYDGETLSTDLSAAANRYMAPGMNVTLTNGLFHTTVNPDFNATTAPNVFTIAKGATFRSAGYFSWNASYDGDVDSDTTVNISGGQMISQNSSSNWFMQNSRRGTLRFNVTDGGLFETGGETYIMTCRDNTTAADTPEMYMMFSNSTFRVANNKNLRIGYDASNKNPLEPKFSLAMTNSILDVGTGIIYLGHNVVGENTAGFYTADFVDSVITAKAFKVYHDRPANSARFDNSTIVLAGTDNWSIETHSGFGQSSTPMTIGAGGLVIDTQTFTGQLQADPQGEGAIAKKGTGILRIMRDQTASAPFVCEEGETYLSDGHSMARAVTVKNGAKFTVNASNTTAVASIALEDGAELRFDNFRERQAPLLVGALTLPAEGTATLTFAGTPAEGKAYELLTITNAQTLAAADIEKLKLPVGYENYSLRLSADGKTLYIVGGSSLVWTGAGADTAWTTDANWLGGAAPDGTVEPTFLEGLISGSRTVTFDDASIAKYVWVDGGTPANPIVFAKADGGAGRLVIDNNNLIVGQKSSEAALTIAPGMSVVAKQFRVGGLASSVSRLTVQGSLYSTGYVCVGSNGAEGEVAAMIDIDGGAVTNEANDLVVGDFAGPSSANYSVVIRNGGEYNSLSTSGIRVSAGADGTIAITNGTLKVESGYINLSNTQAGRGTLILGPGALVVTKRVTSKASTSTGHKVVFDGGTLKAVADDEYFIDPLNNNGVARVEVEVGTGGGTIDTAGKNVAFRTVAGGVGGLAVTGGGELTFNNKNGNRTASAFDYEGATAVAAGTAIRSGADVTTFAGGLSLAAGAMVNVGLVSSAVPCFEADDIAIASGAKIVLDAVAFPAGTYPVLRKTGGGAFTAGDLANLALDTSAMDSLGDFTRLALGGTDNDSICLVVDSTVVPVMGRVASDGEPVTLTGNDVLVGAGGLDIGTLRIPDNGRLVFDPVKTPVYVYSQNSGKYLTFGSGAKLALTPNYAGMTLGRIVLLGYKPDYVNGLPENLNDIFDASTIAPGATYTITSEPIPEKETYASYLVLTVGDYENDAKEIRLTCIGDSITQGTGSGKNIGGATYSTAWPDAQYRTRIAARLAANGYKPKMLGIWKKNYKEATYLAQPEDWSWHSGISGDRIKTGGTRGGVRDNLHVYLDVAGKVDALTLLIGTNDLGAGDTAEETYVAYTNLVFDIARQRPATKIIGSTILDRNGAESENHAKVVAFNALLAADYAANRLPANYVMLDLFAEVPLTSGAHGNFSDDLLHPSWIGHSAIAECFAAGITNALPFASYAGPIEDEATDAPQSALGVAGIAATTDGAGLAAYTNGMMHVFTIDPPGVNNTFTSAPYTATNTATALNRPVTKAGYFMELVRKGTSRHRWVWVDFDATGKTLDEIDFPWTGANVDLVVDDLHVFSNDGSIHNIAANVSGVKGAIEGTHFNYSGGDDDENIPGDITAGIYGWNDTLGSSSGYGSFQAHRIFGEGEHWNEGEVLFAWNAWGTSQTSANDQVGIGMFFYSQALGGDGNSADYTFTSGASNGAADTITAAGYQVVHFEIWATLDGEPRHGVWCGAGMDGDFDTAANWEDGRVPAAGENIDFSAIPAATTISVTGASTNKTFGTATMGSSVVTFTGNVAFAGITDTSKIVVGADSTVTLDGDLEFSGSGYQYVVNTVAAGGTFVVTGDVIAKEDFTGYLYHSKIGGSGAVQARGLVNNATGNSDQWAFRINSDGEGKVYWTVGDHGLSGSRYFWNNGDRPVEICPIDCEFTISTKVGINSDITFNTTGADGNPYTITIGNGTNGNVERSGTLNVIGTGTVVDNFTETSSYAMSGAVNVGNQATLAVIPGKTMTTGTISVSSNATLQVAESGSFALGGGLTLADGAILGFNFTQKKVAPVLDLTDKTVTVNGEVKVKVTAATGIRPIIKSNQFALTSGGNFTGASVALAEGSADWVKDVSVDENGNIVLTLKSTGIYILVR